MNLDDLKFPDWEVPPPRRGQISWEGYLAWLEENRRELIASGKLKEILADPRRCPVDAPFEL